MHVHALPVWQVHGVIVSGRHATSRTSLLMMGCDSQVHVATSDSRLSCSHGSEVGICVWGRQPMIQHRLEVYFAIGASGSGSSSASAEAAAASKACTGTKLLHACFRVTCAPLHGVGGSDWPNRVCSIGSVYQYGCFCPTLVRHEP